MTDVINVKVNKNLKRAILKAVEGLGGFNRFINKGEVVLLKPNFNTSDPFPASSALDFVKTVSDLVYECGAKIVMIGDSSTMSMNTRKVMEKIGVFELEKDQKPPRVYVFDERRWVKRYIPEASYLKMVNLTEFLGRADKLILLPNLKTHFIAQFTGSLKLSLGFVKPYQRVWFHLSHLQEKIAELNKIINPDLILMDARKCFIRGGPSEGRVREPGLILASENRVAIDIEGIRIIQSFKGNSLKNIDPLSLPQIKNAIELGIDKNR